MDLLKLLWFLLWNLKVEHRKDGLLLRVGNLQIRFADNKDVEIKATRDLRLNGGRYLLTSCPEDFEPEAYLEAQQRAQELAREQFDGGCLAKSRREWAAAEPISTVAHR
ncbi:hypothetical protein [Gloeobacter kilaueensis]|uniref:Uncharacterized protein n=1 Tax=Gloeobacter kilaueensis (strain ATCC BAA-2537 / CCAP 1431/1 / ULC 316 / JS1) TaxID=1183438 RepID=U5QL82_GLOK1|nr:hypothetical protein [Gloeobacter kilaueensis]AGY59752.1 hypothetical protein GKIL_3506 [Gloeobacter kilaueensis JS1]